MSELSGFGARAAVTPQTEQANPAQAKNNAGGFTFTLDHWDHLTRFLVLGTAGGTYYANQRAHTTQGVEVVRKCLDLDGARAVALAEEISTSGRAIKNDQAIFVLAVAAGHSNPQTRAAALAAMPKVCRTATHLFQFCELVKEHRGFGRGLRRALAAWYEDRNVDSLAYQLVKYRQRNGWTHRDVLRLSHPKAVVEEQKIAFDFACGRDRDDLAALPFIDGFRKAQAEGADLPALVREYKLPWEALPKLDKATWIALIETGALPIGATLRQLPTLTRAGVFEDGSILADTLDRLTDVDTLIKGRIHPFQVLVATMTYKAGRSFRGDNTWTPVTALIDGLNDAFYKAFGAVEPMGGRTCLALDVSGSMGVPLNNSPITARDGSAAMALVNLATEAPGAVEVIGFTSGDWYGSRRGTTPGNRGVSTLNISARQRLDDVIRSISDLPFGGTDCSAPMLWAQDEGKSFDQFIVYTDNETWAGHIHPFQALRDYRKAVNPNARLVVVGMTATNFTIADPSDAGMLDVVGFDTAAPNLIADFCRGQL